jgi:uncharacterized protein (TIGR02722 family)
MKTSLMTRLRLLALLGLAAALSACMGGSSVYVPVETVTQFDDRFSDTDLRGMAEKMTRSLVSSVEIANATGTSSIALLNIRNATSEFINTNSILDKMLVALLQTGRFSIVERNQIDKAASELNLSQSGFINNDSALRMGQGVAAKYVVFGELDSIRKESRTASLSYYKLTLKCLNCETTALIWADEYELKKAARKSMLQWQP